MEDGRMNAVIDIAELDEGATPLSGSPLLQQVSQHAVELSRVYGRGAFRCPIGETTWSFAWLHEPATIAHVELLLRIGGTPVSVALEDLQLFGAVDVMRPELSAELRAACLSSYATPVWERLEKITRRAVDLVAVRLHDSLRMPPDALGFEISACSRGVATRGFLRVLDPALSHILFEASVREMPPAQVRPDTPVRWTAVVGSSSLSSSEVRALEEHDIIVIDDADFSADALGCWLGVGPTRRRAGHVSLRDGRIHLHDFNLEGRSVMSPRDADELPDHVSGFEEIPVNVRFEVAQWQAPLGEIAALAPGSIIDLGQRVDAQAVSVWVEQRCIGKGQLVAIGERLGVRLLTTAAGAADPR
jgi:type III secretion protein Q